MRLASIVGTRPNFIKEFVVHRELAARGVEEIIVHTGQHYDPEMSDIFFRELDIPQPDYVGTVPKGRHGRETAAALEFIEDVLIKERPDVTLVYGDVTSTLAGALASAKLEIPVAHVEAGLRTPFRYNPEEINRRLTDVVSQTLFPHIQEAYDALVAEGYPLEDIFLVGDVMKDSLLSIIEEHGIPIEPGDYHVATIHRAENTDSPRRLTNIIEALIECGDRIVFPAHPRTMQRIEEYGLSERLFRARNVQLIPPQGYVDFIRLLAGACKVLTDSGGVRREAYILGKPVIVLVEIVWVLAMLRSGWSVIVDMEKKSEIMDAIRNHAPQGERPQIFGDGRAAARIVDILLQRYR